VKPYLFSLAAGILVGVIYALINVRSPAPPVIALAGLLGILLGEQAAPLVKRLMRSQPVSVAWAKQECAPHVLGMLPSGKSSRLACTEPSKATRPAA
jgi:XapX domain-containing protein